MTEFRFRIQHCQGPDEYDASYSQLKSAKMMLTKRVRNFRDYGWRIVDQETGKHYAYDEETHTVKECMP